MTRKPYWKPQHETFIRELLAHGDITQAYKAAYPNSSAARTNGARLYHQPHIQQRIAPVLQQRREEEMELSQDAAVQRMLAELRDVDEKRAFLARVVNGEVSKNHIYRSHGRTAAVESGFTAGDVISAIELDNKLEDGYPDKAILDRQFARLVAKAV